MSRPLFLVAALVSLSVLLLLVEGARDIPSLLEGTTQDLHLQHRVELRSTPLLPSEGPEYLSKACIPLNSLKVVGGGKHKGDEIQTRVFSPKALIETLLRFAGEVALLAAVAAAGAAALPLLPAGAAAGAADALLWATVVFGSSWLARLPGQAAAGAGFQLARPTTAGGGQGTAAWYRGLAKPAWNPPDWLFPVMWIPLKTLQVAGAALVWRAVGRRWAHPAVLAFLGYQALGDLWNALFFDQRRIGFGLVAIYALYASLAASTAAFAQVRPLAGALVLPTNIWLFVASSLNFSIWLRNGKESLLPTTAKL